MKQETHVHMHLVMLSNQGFLRLLMSDVQKKNKLWISWKFEITTTVMRMNSPDGTRIVRILDKNAPVLKWKKSQ